MMRHVSLGVAFLLLAGCFGGGPAKEPQRSPDPFDVRDRHLLDFSTTGRWSRTLLNGTYGALDVLEADVPFTLPLGTGVPSSTINLGVFRPKVPDGMRVPVVADIGPYFGEGSEQPTTEPASRLGAFLIENLVPHGFAVAQISVSGTGKSGGCMDFMGPVEQAGIDAAVRWLAAQPWSNGNIGLIGRSYDGSTPWQAAMFPDTPVKTVVPISGLTGIYQLMWKNGSAESRAPGGLWAIYYSDSFTPTDGYDAEFARRAAEALVCPTSLQGGPEGVLTFVHGSSPAPQADTYWEERHFAPEVLANYKGSVYFIHGLQDWNVDPHLAFPFYGELQKKGLDVKGLFGQWAHDYPDRIGEHEECDGYTKRCHPPQSVRADWAEDLRQWFDHYLRGNATKPQLHVEIQDGNGTWRVEPTYPPADTAWRTFKLGPDLTGSASELAFGEQLVFTSGALEDDVRVAGLIQFHVQVTPSGPGGQLFIELRNKNQNRHVAHAVMDLRYAAGGAEARPVVAGVPLVAKMEFFPADDVLRKGDRLELRIAMEGEDYLSSNAPAPIALDVTGASVLRLPTVQRDGSSFFTPPNMTGGGEAENPT